MSISAHTPENPCLHEADDPACRNYHPGHRVHHIQARLAAEHRDRWIPVQLGTLQGTTLEATFPDGETRTWWNHDPALLERFHTLQGHGATASFDPGTSLATVEATPGRLALLNPAVVNQR